MRTSACSAVVGIWLVLMAGAGGAVAAVETKSHADDIYWSDQFHFPGADGKVCAAVKDESGNIYIGGDFTVAGDVVGNGIAKWNVSTGTWSALGTGIEGGIEWSDEGEEYHTSVYALAIDASGNVYVGGNFTMAGGVSVNHIAKWDGAAWSALGTGMGGTGWGGKGPWVNALAVDGSGNLYAGGVFTTAGGVAANYIAKWNGTAWSALGTGTDSMVNALAVDGSGNVYAGGSWFSTAGGIPAESIARWDGTAWSALGSGINGQVLALVMDDSGNLYAGGDFTTAGGIAANNIARWDGSAWSALGTGVGGDRNFWDWVPSVNALAVDGSGNVYAGGDFTTAGGVAAENIARWDGSGWSALGTGVGKDNEYYWHPNVYAVHALAVDVSGNLYAWGDFTTAGGVAAQNIAKWDGMAWSALGSGISGPVSAVAVDGSGSVYAGGDFATAEGVPVNNIAKWDGSEWSALGTGMGVIDEEDGKPVVITLALDGSGHLYAGGNFTTAGGVSAKNIAKWSGTAWSALGSGVNGPVGAVALDDLGNLYAGGRFTMAGGVLANNIAKWDGAAWSAVGSGIDGDPSVWDWIPYVEALAVDGSGNLYAGGHFTTAGGVTAKNIAKWDGTGWSALGTGMWGIEEEDVWWLAVYALAVDGLGNLYAGGDFTTAGGVMANCIARWDGTAWSALGTGMGGIYGEDVGPCVAALAVDSLGNLYAAGYFTTADGTSADSIAKWDGAAWSALGSGMGGRYPGVYDLTIDGSNNLYAGGWFTAAGGKVSGYFAAWRPGGATPPPNPPIVTGTTPTEDTMPTWTWSSGGGGNGTYRYQLDGTVGTWTQTTGSSYTPAIPLPEGAHTLYVQERNNDGNWSSSGSFEIVIISPGEGESEGEDDDNGPPAGCFGG